MLTFLQLPWQHNEILNNERAFVLPQHWEKVNMKLITSFGRKREISLQRPMFVHLNSYPFKTHVLKFSKTCMRCTSEPIKLISTTKGHFNTCTAGEGLVFNLSIQNLIISASLPTEPDPSHKPCASALSLPLAVPQGRSLTHSSCNGPTALQLALCKPTVATSKTSQINLVMKHVWSL